MRVYRWLCLAALICGLTAIAKADDFQMVVIDPIPTPHTDITHDNFTFSLGPCNSTQVPAHNPAYIGCFSGENETGHTITSLQIFVPNSLGLSGQTAGCADFGGGLDIFTNISCTTETNGYLLLFSGGSIPSDSATHEDDGNPAYFFTIAEYGADPSAFQNVQGEFNPVPEPNSALLLGSGLLAGLAYVAINRRRLAVLPLAE